MSQDDRRNPYLILGVPFGASEKEARSGFSRAKRRLRGGADTAYTQEDLTWALHQVEQIISNPELAFDVYRIPAIGRSEPEGVFNPAPHRLPRSTKQATAEEWDGLRRSALASVLRRALAEAIPEQTDSIPYESAKE